MPDFPDDRFGNYRKMKAAEEAIIPMPANTAIPKYDYLIVGAGLFGSVFAREAADAGRRVLVIDRRGNIGGNVYTEEREGITVHKYGAHIFHTNDQRVWEYVNRFASFNSFINCPKANYRGEIYSLPFNMNTFHEMWGVTTAEEARAIIAKQVSAEKLKTSEPANLEEQALVLVGRDIFEKLVKGYTEKQWGRPCRELPAFIIKRLPLRFTYDNNYFNALYQGIPKGGYTKLVENLLKGIEVRLGYEYAGGEIRPMGIHAEARAAKDFCTREISAKKIVYTGPIDAYFNYQMGALKYRSLRFESEWLDIPCFQNTAVVNYTDPETPWTRIIEHKHFEDSPGGGSGCEIRKANLPYTIITREFSAEWKAGTEPFYPVNDEENDRLYRAYSEMAGRESNVIFGGRLAEYRYYDMDQVIAAALKACEQELKTN